MKPIRHHVIHTLALLVPAISGCKEEDQTAPVAPLVDEVESPTPDTELRVSGTAEPGSTVRVSGGSEAVEVVADPYTAKWSVTVTLASGTNVLSVTATDAAGNESEATAVEIEHVAAGAAASIEVIGPESTRAGEPAKFTVRVVDTYGNEVQDPAFMLTTDAPSGSTQFEAPGTYSFCGVGTWTVTAQAGDVELTGSASIEVTPGRPAAVSLETVPSPVVVTAGDTVEYTTTVLDSCGNETEDFKDVWTNAPSALCAEGTVSNLVRAGSWSLVAEVPGFSAMASADMLVDADAASTAVALDLTSSTANVGLPIGFDVIAVDGFGNAIDTAPVITVPTDPGATVDTATSTVIFSDGGVHTVTATVGSASDSKVVVVSDPDVVPPTVAITSPAAATVFADGDTVTVTVDVTDDVGVAQVLFQAIDIDDSYQSELIPLDADTGAPRTSVTSTFTFDVGVRFGDIVLVAQALDTAGNLASSASVTVRADPAADVIVPDGYTIATVGFHGLLSGPRGVAVGPDGLIYVANNGTSTDVVRLDPDTHTLSAFTGDIAGASSEDIVYHPGTNAFFLSARGNNRMYHIDSAGVATDFTGAMGGFTPRGIILDTVADEVFVSTLRSDGTIARYDAAAAPLSAPVFTMSTDAFLNGAPYGLVQTGASYAAGDEADSNAFRFEAPLVSGGQVLNEQQIAEDPPLDAPRDMVLGASGALYIANEANGTIVRVEIEGCVTEPCATSTFASGFDSPWGLAFDASGNLIVTDEGDNTVVRITGSF